MAAQSERAIGGFLIDGFPRDNDILDGWMRSIVGRTSCVELVLYINAPLDVCRARCLKRGRSDDNEVSIENRIRYFTERTLPVIEYFKSLNLIYELDGTMKPNAVSFSHLLYSEERLHPFAVI